MIAYSLNRVANWHVNLDEPDVALPLHEEALALFTSMRRSRRDRRHPRFSRHGELSERGISRSAHGYCEQAIALFRELDDRQRLVLVPDVAGGHWRRSSPGSRLRSIASRATGSGAAKKDSAIAREIGWSAGEAFALMCLSMATVSRGDLGRALREAESGAWLSRSASVISNGSLPRDRHCRGLDGAARSAAAPLLNWSRRSSPRASPARDSGPMPRSPSLASLHTSPEISTRPPRSWDTSSSPRTLISH